MAWSVQVSCQIFLIVLILSCLKDLQFGRLTPNARRTLPLAWREMTHYSVWKGVMSISLTTKTSTLRARIALHGHLWHQHYCPVLHHACFSEVAV